MKALFVSENYIKENTPINDNVDLKMLRTAIIEAQDLHLIEAIGSHLYKDLADKIINDNLNNDEVDLITTYVKPMLKYWTLVEVLPLLLFKMTNKSVSTSSSDNSQPVQYEDMKMLLNQSKAKAEVYTERMIKYIQANFQKFPEFYATNSTVDTIYPKSQQFTTNWYLGEGRVASNFRDYYNDKDK